MSPNASTAKATPYRREVPLQQPAVDAARGSPRGCGRRRPGRTAACRRPRSAHSVVSLRVPGRVTVNSPAGSRSIQARSELGQRLPGSPSTLAPRLAGPLRRHADWTSQRAWYGSQHDVPVGQRAVSSFSASRGPVAQRDHPARQRLHVRGHVVEPDQGLGREAPDASTSTAGFTGSITSRLDRGVHARQAGPDRDRLPQAVPDPVLERVRRRAGARPPPSASAVGAPTGCRRRGPGSSTKS